MAEVKWIKIVTDVFDDEKILMIESMPEADGIIVIWFKLLCLAGKQNNSGVFQMGRMPYTDEMFATIFRRPINTVRLALSAFEQFGMIEIVNNTVTIPNWGKHQSIDRMEAKNEYLKNYMREYRKKQKLLSEEGKVNSKVNGKVNVNRLDKIREEETRLEETRAEENIEVASAPSKPTRHKYGEYKNVLLSDDEYAKLVSEFPNDYEQRIERLSGYIASTGKTYKNHLATIRNWAKRDGEKKTQTGSSNVFLDILKNS